MRKVGRVFCLLVLSFYLILGINAFAQPPNVQVNQADHTTGTFDNNTVQSETSHAVFGSTIVVGWNDTSQFATTGIGGLTSITGYGFSTDGGGTFTDAGLLAPAPGFINLGDPALVVDSTGTFYFASLAVNNAFSLGGSRIAVAQSTSTSPTVTFGTPVLIQGLLTTGSPFQDKELIAVDTSGGPFGGRVYVVWTEFASLFDATPKILFTRSTSTSPLAFATPIALSPTDALNQGAMPAVGPDGEVYVVWGRFTGSPITAQSVRLVKSTNGGFSFVNPDPADPAPNKTVATPTPAPAFMTSGGIVIRTRGFPYIAVDSTSVGSPTRGNVYIVFQADPDAAGPDRSDIFFTRSTDGGATWSTPRSINTAPAVTLNPDTSTNDNWQPFIAVSPSNGHIVVTFYDRRNDSANTKITLFKAVSTDAGLTWVNEQVSTVAFTPATGYDPGAVSTYMGDYNYAVADGSNFHMTWGDTRNTCTPPPGAISPCSPASRPDQDVFYAKQPISVVTVTGPQWYIGGGFGFTNTEIAAFDTLVAGGLDTDDSDSAFKLFGGRKFGPHFAVEFGYEDLGDYSQENPTNNRTEFDGTVLFVEFVGWLDVHTNVDLFGKLGLAYWDVDIDYTDFVLSSSDGDNGIDPVLGLGFEYHFPASPWAIRGEWEQYQNVGEDVRTRQVPLTTDIELNGQDINVFGVTVTYEF